MALILLEGLDRTGKSTVAEFFHQEQGYEIIHLSAPLKGTTPDQYLQEIVDLISAASTRDIVLDRSHYGELVWPIVYGRKPLLTEEDIDAIREIEESVGVKRIWMHDPDTEAHWKRCTDNKEPLNKAQFARARSLYSQFAHKYGFEPITLQQFIKEFPAAEKYNNQSSHLIVTVSGDNVQVSDADLSESVSSTPAKYHSGKTPEQLKLEKANAINDILSKKILKSKGLIYDELENEIREFLNQKLGNLFGNQSSKELSLTQEEIKFYKTMYIKATKTK
jgi:hypothetical protein